jgi:hypothetical protein
VHVAGHSVVAVARAIGHLSALAVERPAGYAILGRRNAGILILVNGYEVDVDLLIAVDQANL